MDLTKTNCKDSTQFFFNWWVLLPTPPNVHLQIFRRSLKCHWNIILQAKLSFTTLKPQSSNAPLPLAATSNALTLILFVVVIADLFSLSTIIHIHWFGWFLIYWMFLVDLQFGDVRWGFWFFDVRNELF